MLGRIPMVPVGETGTYQYSMSKEGNTFPGISCDEEGQCVSYLYVSCMYFVCNWNVDSVYLVCNLCSFKIICM